MKIWKFFILVSFEEIGSAVIISDLLILVWPWLIVHLSVKCNEYGQINSFKSLIMSFKILKISFTDKPLIFGQYDIQFRYLDRCIEFQNQFVSNRVRRTNRGHDWWNMQFSVVEFNKLKPLNNFWTSSFFLWLMIHKFWTFRYGQAGIKYVNSK